MAVDYAAGDSHWRAFRQSVILTCATGGLLALACANGMAGRLSLRQTFLLATGVWVVLPLYGALPFVFGATGARPVDAVFEAMSGMTATGATVFVGLEARPGGLLLWRSMLQWSGGIGIIIVAMVFLPELRVGGMQIFRSEAFDTGGKVLPRAAEIAARIGGICVGLTLARGLAYAAVGMNGFETVNHALTTLSTRGFSTSDASFGAFQGVPEYFAAIFMCWRACPSCAMSRCSPGPPRRTGAIRRCAPSSGRLRSSWPWSPPTASSRTTTMRSMPSARPSSTSPRSSPAPDTRVSTTRSGAAFRSCSSSSSASSAAAPGPPAVR